MTTLRIICKFTNPQFTTIPGNMQINPLNNYRNTIIASARYISSFKVSKDLELITNEKLNAKVSNLKLSVPQEKPLVVCLTWLLAKRKNILKYANLYLQQGFDVLNVSVTPWQVLWPAKGTQLVAKNLLEFLKANETYGPLVLHGFSVGAYLWGEALVHIAQENERYQSVSDRICGQIWDSSVDVTEIHLGVPPAVFSKNVVLRNALQQYILYHLKTFHKVATIHYIRASQMFHTNSVKAPALFFLSKADPIGAVSANTRARESWESMGIPVYWKCFEKSPHVGHYRYHPEEYKMELFAFLDKLALAAQQKKIKLNV